MSEVEDREPFRLKPTRSELLALLSGAAIKAVTAKQAKLTRQMNDGPGAAAKKAFDELDSWWDGITGAQINRIHSRLVAITQTYSRAVKIAAGRESALTCRLYKPTVPPRQGANWDLPRPIRLDFGVVTVEIRIPPAPKRLRNRLAAEMKAKQEFQAQLDRLSNLKNQIASSPVNFVLQEMSDEDLVDWKTFERLKDQLSHLELVFPLSKVRQ